MIWYFKSNQKQNNRNRKEIKERERRKLPGAHLPGPARPSPSPLPLSSSSSPEGPRRGARPRVLGHLLLPLATSCFLSSPWTPSATPRTLPGLALSPVPSPPLLWLPLSSTERSPVATDAVRRGHHHPLSSPTRSRAPQCLPRPLHRLTRPEKPRSAIPTLFPSSATEDRRCRFAASDASPSSPRPPSQPP